MSERDLWDRRYSGREYIARSYPSPFLVDWIDRIPVGRALDIACGTGRNSMPLAEAGFRVDAVDISPVAIDMARQAAREHSLTINWRATDLGDFEIAPSAYDLITVFRYRDPDLWPRLLAGLATDGWMLFETHVKTHLQVDGPTSPEYRLDHQELLEAFRTLRVLHYSETVETTNGPFGREVVARVAACNGDPGW